MIAYCTQDDLLTHISLDTLAALSNDIPNASTADDTVVNGLIGHAQTVIDSVLDGTFSVPFSPAPSTPPIVNNICVDIVIYLLYNRRAMSIEMPKDVRSEYEKALKELDDINSLIVSIGITPIQSKGGEMVSTDSKIGFDDATSPMSFF